jgi:hypothetical protein
MVGLACPSRGMELQAHRQRRVADLLRPTDGPDGGIARGKRHLVQNLFISDASRVDVTVCILYALQARNLRICDTMKTVD